MKIIQTFLFETDFYEQIRQTIIYLQKIVRYRMQSIKTISEINKIDTQSRADAYILEERG